jgi:hypothetical protein
MLGCVFSVFVRPLFYRCMVTQVTASSQMLYFLNTPFACLATSGLGLFRC